MNRRNILKDNQQILFWIFIVCYTVLFLVDPNFGPTDDFHFVRTIQSGSYLNYYSEQFPYYDSIKIGRFQPLAAIEYNLIPLLGAPLEARSYYLIHAFQFLITVVLLHRLIKNKVRTDLIWISAIILIILTPGFSYSWFRLQLVERNIFTLIIIMLLSYEYGMTKRKKSIPFIVASIASLLIVFMKETGFILISTFSLVSLWILSGQTDKEEIKLRTFHIVNLVYSFSYILVYAWIVLPERGALTYGVGPINFGEKLIKNLLNYAFVSDPIVFFIILPLALQRLCMLNKRKSLDLYLDPMLISSLAFVAAYFVLNLQGVYYFQPVYVLSLIPILRTLEIAKLLQIKAIGLTVVILTTLNAIPTAIHYIAYYKNAPSNFSSAIETVAADIKKRERNKKPTIYLDGINFGTGRFMYFIYSEFFVMRNLTNENYDMASMENSDLTPEINLKPFIFLTRIDPKFTIFEQQVPREPNSGDYLILSSQSTNSIKQPDNQKYRESLYPNYELMYSFTSKYEFKFWNLKNLGRYILSVNAIPDSKIFTIGRHAPNMESSDFYVYKKK